ncbi:MAG: 16S rRNA (cytosine(1402)-N(4))-methyltransferase RsmH [Planctomycetota bacterium]
MCSSDLTHTASHVPVLPMEVLAALSPRPGETYADATAGLGGHADLIAPHLSPGGCVVLNDVDPGNLVRASAAVAAAAPGVKVEQLTGNFADMPRKLGATPVDMVLADLGFSSNQMEDGSRGLSFMREGPLDMRLDPTLPTTAADLVNSLSEDELTRILREYGEEMGAGRIARKVVLERTRSPITSTTRFAEIVRTSLGLPKGPRNGPIDPATRAFQALRIAVNDELGSLEALLAGVGRAARSRKSSGPIEQGAGGWLSPGARVAIICFHSLEDRIVKRAFAELVAAGVAEFVGKKGVGRGGGPVEASESEVGRNPRSRSAKMRCIRIGGGVGSNA